MRVEKAFKLERVALGEQQLPDDRHDRRPHDRLRIVEIRPGSDLAALDAAGQQPAEQGDGALDQLGMIEFGELGEFQRCRDQQAEQLMRMRCRC
ncbi:MAG: hypothetical protein WB678_04815 [Stellaceae bacterium]